MKTKILPFLNIVFVFVIVLVSLVTEPTLITTNAQSVAEEHNCRFWGIISSAAPTTVIQDHLVNLPNSIKNLGDSSNPDGWSVGYYPDGNDDPTVNRGFPQASTDPNYDLAATEAANATPRVAVSHVRNTSSGVIPPGGDPHPFERVKDGRHWLMGHNGTIDKDVLLDLIRPDYFAANPPQYGTNQSEWIDSDLYQIFVLQTLEDFNFQVKPALGYVIRRLREEIGPGTSPSTEQLNFFLTDGTTLWAYREGNSIHTLYYLYDTSGTPYSAVASQYPTASQGSWIEMSNGELVTMEQVGSPVLENIEDYFGGALLVDNYFDDSADSADLRANGAGQDWYESREDSSPGPMLLTLDETDVAGNASKKAKLTASTQAPGGNVYVSQEFGAAQNGEFAVQWDIYVDSIENISGAPDRAGWMLIGDNTVSPPGPNSDNSERFVYMGFFKDGGGTSGTMDLVARDRNDGWTSFTTLATGLNLEQWYTIKVECNVTAGTYDVYVDGVLQATAVTSRNAKTEVTHISFAQWDDGAGTFYVDNVYQVSGGTNYTLTMAVNPTGAGTTDPSVGAHIYAEGTPVTVSAFANAGYEFDNWTGDVVDPNSATTTVTMDGDKTITAHFSPVSVVLPEFEVSKVYESSRVAGTVVTYTLAVTNTGNISGTTVVLSDTLPLELEYIEGDGIYDGTDVSWTFDSIPAEGGIDTGWFSANLPCTIETVSNVEYRVTGSAEGVDSPNGPTVSVDTLEPTIEVGFTRTPSPIVVGQTVHFTATATTNGTELSYEWDFRDGETGNGQTTSHIYTWDDDFFVILYAVDQCGFFIATGTEHTVNPPDLVADFDQSATEVVVGTTVYFTDTTTTDGPDIVAWAWDFGVDSDPAITQNPSHAYTEPGIYTVTLTVTDTLDYSDEEIKPNLITVSSTCTPLSSVTFTYQPEQPLIGSPVTFEAHNTPANATEPITYDWDFDDGLTGNGAVVQHTFTSYGTLNVKVTATNACTPAGVSDEQLVVISPYMMYWPLVVR